MHMSMTHNQSPLYYSAKSSIEVRIYSLADQLFIGWIPCSENVLQPPFAAVEGLKQSVPTFK